MFMIIFDKQRLQQILMNLVANSVKFTPFGGNIKVTSKLIYSEEDLSITDESFTKVMLNANGRTFLEVQVEDTGVGIKKEDQSKLFKLFGFLESSKELNSRGIGLGLNISRKISKMFDGDIICRS